MCLLAMISCLIRALDSYTAVAEDLVNAFKTRCICPISRRKRILTSATRNRDVDADLPQQDQGVDEEP